MIYCSQCGSILKEEDNFCSKCGAKQHVDDLMSNTQRINYNEGKQTGEEPIGHRSKKHSGHKKWYKIIIIGVLIVLIILSVGFGSYYIYSSKLAAENTQKSNTHPNITPKSNNNSNSSSTTASTDKNQSNNSKADTNTNNTAAKIKSSDNYIFPKSGDEKLSDSDLSSLSKENLSLVRNEIFARHGYVFQSEPYKSYFNGKSWYKPNSNFKGTNEELNSAERYNLQLILKYEKK